MTPDEGNAEAYGAVFLRKRCAKKGGITVMKLGFDISKLKKNGVKSLKAGRPAQKFWDDQRALGKAIREYLTGPSSSQTTGSPTEILVPPNPEQIADIRKDTSSPKRIAKSLWAAYDSITPYDVIVGTVPMLDNQAKAAPAIKQPFNQVVLVTEEALEALSYLDRNPLKKKPPVVARDTEVLDLKQPEHARLEIGLQ